MMNDVVRKLIELPPDQMYDYIKEWKEARGDKEKSYWFALKWQIPVDYDPYFDRE